MANLFHQTDPKWWSCEGKTRYENEPPLQKGMRSYACTFCAGWHYATATSGDDKNARSSDGQA